MINLKLSSLLTSLALIFTSIGVEAQTVRKSLPMNVFTSEGMYDLTVPDTQTTKSAFDGKLRIYDVHIAKMFEVTYLDCQQFGEGGSREWSYFAGNGNINMGTFYIPCKLVYDIVAAYGLGLSKNTPIIYGQEEAGLPYTKMLAVPKESIVSFCQKHYIQRFSLFGSVLRSDFNEQSDIDVLVEFSPEHIPGLITLAKMELELSSIFKRTVNLRTPEDLSRYFRQQVLDLAEV